MINKLQQTQGLKAADDYSLGLNSATSTKNGKGQNIGAFLNKMATGNEAGAATSTKVKNNDEISKEDFMMLLVAELQNQDPLEPMNNQEFGAQLAQFSQLEQLEEMNNNISKMTNSNEPIIKMFSASLIGKSIATESVDFEHTKGKTEDLSFNIPRDAANLEIRIIDATENTIKTIDAGEQKAGLNYVKWDGKAKDGRISSDGKYRFEVDATDQQGAKINVERGVTGKVISVDYSDNDVALILESGNRIKMNDIKNIGDLGVAKKSKEIANAYQKVAEGSKTAAAIKNEIQHKVLDQAMADRKVAGEKI